VKENFRNYFVIQFDKPIKDFGTWENVKGEKFNGEMEREGRGAGAFIRFDDGVKVQAKIASSYISQEQAERNMEMELGKFKSIEDTKAAAWEIWNQHLQKILVEGGTEEQIATFYSCYFRASLFSRQFFEIDQSGSPYYYSPYDGTIHPGYLYTDPFFLLFFQKPYKLNIEQGKYLIYHASFVESIITISYVKIIYAQYSYVFFDSHFKGRIESNKCTE
jgi:putative alpha-1,2-mannosidase